MIPWVNYDASPLIEAKERRMERNKNLLVSAATMGMNMKQQAAENLLKQQQLAQSAQEHAGKQSIDQQHLDLLKGKMGIDQNVDAANALARARTMMTPGHADYNPEGARAILKAYGFDIGEGGGGGQQGPDDLMQPTMF